MERSGAIAAFLLVFGGLAGFLGLSAAATYTTPAEGYKLYERYLQMGPDLNQPLLHSRHLVRRDGQTGELKLDEVCAQLSRGGPVYPEDIAHRRPEGVPGDVTVTAARKEARWGRAAYRVNITYDTGGQWTHTEEVLFDAANFEFLELTRKFDYIDSGSGDHVITSEKLARLKPGQASSPGSPEPRGCR